MNLNDTKDLTDESLSFFRLTNPELHKPLDEKVISFLKELNGLSVNEIDYVLIQTKKLVIHHCTINSDNLSVKDL